MSDRETTPRTPPPTDRTCKDCGRAPVVVYHDRCQSWLVRLATKRPGQ